MGNRVLTCKGVDFELALFALVPFGYEFGQTSNAIATHFGLATVVVENPHRKVRSVLARRRKDDPICTNAEVAIAERRCLSRRHRQLRRLTVIDLSTSRELYTPLCIP